jgi:hypothetical protein
VVGVAVAGAAVWTFKNAVFMPIYTANIMQLKWWTFIPSFGASVIGTLAVGMVSYGTTLLYMPRGWITLAASAFAVSLFYGLGVVTLGLNRTDWQLLMNMLPFQINRDGFSKDEVVESIT